MATATRPADAEAAKVFDEIERLALKKNGLEVTRLTIRIDTIHNPKTGFTRKLKRPLTLLAVRDIAYWVVSARVTAGYGTDPKLSKAIVDYMADWEERLRSLEEDESILGPGLVQELATLRRLMA